MDDKDILQKIIDENGSCDWTAHSHPQPYYICSVCPMSKLKKREDGEGYLSCYDAIGILESDTHFETDQKYKEKATEVLFDLVLEDLLGEDIDE
jgi:hypothetical protein